MRFISQKILLNLLGIKIFYNIKDKKFILDIFLLLSVLFCIIVFYYKISGDIGYNWQFYRISEFLIKTNENGYEPGVLLKGLFVTLKISFISLILAFIFGLASALFRLSDSFMLNGISLFYVETIRNTPLLIQIFFNYFVVSPIIDISPFKTAVLTLSLFEGAYASEIIRGGINSIPWGQTEAAKALGMNNRLLFTYVILPQGLKKVIPPLTSQSISLIKDSALVSTISVYELTLYGQAIISETFLTFEIWFIVAIIYLIINFTLSVVIKLLTKK